ncbi:hypothetical protein [Snodgrassella sp.]|uniref:hypothetical protein n=1 Tax=Snodgrassella sp. TaxID=2815304 RepID=UPI00258FAEB0|nr:hypothetical protein [Snodgrassella sp.]MCO6526217.1 hypothetical protein [Snodgrassella sp.]
MTVSLMISPILTEQEQLRERQKCAARDLRLKEEQTDSEVKRVANMYALMSDIERMYVVIF